MKRDMDLIRAIMLEVEKHPDSPASLNIPVVIHGYEDEIIAGHIRLLDDAGYVEARDWGHSGHIEWRVERLTNDGHDFLAAARDNSLWNRAKAKLGSDFYTIGLSIVGEVMSQMVRSQLSKAGLLPS